MTLTLDDVRRAAQTISGEVVRTPMIAAPALSSLAGADLRLKLETLQHTGSFKARGALNKLRSLPASRRRGGVIACSAGNHAQGVAYFAKRLDVPATIVMPALTPFTKVERTEALGARVVLEGETVAESETFALEVAEREGLAFVHPYDDPAIASGQGTIGPEMLEDVPDLDVIIAPIGGGGLIAGIATAAKAIKPSLTVIGVETALFPSMHNAVKGGSHAMGGATLADGIAIKTPGAVTRPVVERLVEDVVLLDEAAIERAVESLVVHAGIVAEGAGATPLGAVLADPDRFRGRRVGLVITGRNIDPRLLATVLLRGLVRDGRLVRLRVQISDVPGVLAQVSRVIGDTGGNIVDIIHQRLFYDVPVKHAEVDAAVETRSPGHADEIIARLRDAGFPTRLLGSTATEEIRSG